MSSLCLACKEGDLERVKELIRDKKDLEERVSYSHQEWKKTDKPIRECTAVIIASAEGHSLIVRELTKAGANVNAKDACKGRRRTALHYACKLGHLQVVQTLLEVNATLTKRTMITVPL